MKEEIFKKVLAGERLDDCEWAVLWNEATIYELGRVAHELRLKKADPRVVTFVIDRNINYTNVCVSGCRFCAFYRRAGDDGAYVISRSELYEKIEEAISLGATQILLQGGLHPELGLGFYTDLLRGIKERFRIHIHGFSPPEIIHISKISGMSIRDTLVTLREAGLDTIPGGGAEILDDRVRREISPHKISAFQWIEVMREAHAIGMKTTATMMFGSVETADNILNHLKLIRELQDETGGFTAFIPWCFQPRNTELGESEAFRSRKTSFIRSVPGYLKILALSRIYLDNFRNLQVSWVTMGIKVAQVALSFGANDFGSLMIEENVVKAAGVAFRVQKDELVDAIKAAGFVPAVRNTYYEVLERVG